MAELKGVLGTLYQVEKQKDEFFILDTRLPFEYPIYMANITGITTAVPTSGSVIFPMFIS